MGQLSESRMACCKLCGRKESAKRVLGDNKICSVCTKKLKDNNYELISTKVNKEIINSTLLNESNQFNEIDIREFTKRVCIEEHKRLYNIINNLSEQIKFVKQDIERKSQLIEDLVAEVRRNKSAPDATNKIPPTFKTVTDKNVPKVRKSSQKTNFFHDNRYQPLYHISDSVDESGDPYMYYDDANMVTGNTGSFGKNMGIQANQSRTKKRPSIVTNQNSENDILFKKTVPGNANYADITKQGKKTCIIGGSIVKRIDVTEFNEWLENGVAIKRCFPGATASQVNYYIEEVLNEQKLDQVILHVGTNNLTKKYQTVEETVGELLNIVKKCHGVNNVFVSSLTCRPAYQRKVDEINQLLHDYAGTLNYTFIDNSHIEKQHLWKDLLHLNDQGTINLACNFLDALNNSPYNNFY